MLITRPGMSPHPSFGDPGLVLDTMMFERPIFDAHAGVDGLPVRDLENLAYFGVRALVTAAHDGFAGALRGDIESFLDSLVQETVPNLRAAGIAGYAAVGIHPAKIPLQGLEALLARLPAYLGRPEVVAVGGVGLDAGGRWEEEVFGRQIDLAVHVRLPIVVAAPRHGDGRLLRRVLALLRRHEVSAKQVLFTGVDERDAITVRSCRYLVALGSMGAREAASLVARLGPEGFVSSSDLGPGRPDPLVPARLMAAMEAEGLSRAVIRRVAFENAAAFYGRPELMGGSATQTGRAL